MSVSCHCCKLEFEQISNHWRQSSECNYPDISDTQKEVCVGLIMGDGTVANPKDANPYLQCINTNKEYLEYLDGVFDLLGTSVRFHMSAEEKAEENKESGFHESANKGNYSDQYIWKTRCSPKFKHFSEWYSSGEKVWPDEIQLTPTTLKHWYCGDGCWNNNGTSNCISIALKNEIDNKDKVNKMFKKIGFEISNWNKHEIQFSVSESNKLWNYMGKPLPGFEYKWPTKVET